MQSEHNIMHVTGLQFKIFLAFSMYVKCMHDVSGFHNQGLDDKLQLMTDFICNHACSHVAIVIVA